MAEQPDRQLVFIENLVDEGATIAGDVIEVAMGTFAIHGLLAVDGETILAEYRTEGEARAALTELSDFARHLDEH